MLSGATTWDSKENIPIVGGSLLDNAALESKHLKNTHTRNPKKSTFILAAIMELPQRPSDGGID